MICSDLLPVLTNQKECYLHDRIADDNYKVTDAEVIQYMRQVVTALKRIHEKSIVHLDIKVSIMLIEKSR